MGQENARKYPVYMDKVISEFKIRWKNVVDQLLKWGVR